MDHFMPLEGRDAQTRRVGPADGRKQPPRVHWISEEVCDLGHCAIVIFRQDHNISVPGRNFDDDVVVVDLLDESEQVLACFSSGNRSHCRLP
jgi:hypothetical protein